MIEFIEECRREWKRLGVADPVANEMAADLTADIEEAEAEGGSAEDVLGDSLFDPRRFAAAWAGARGVTAPVPVEPSPLPEREPPRWRRPIAACLLAVAALFMVLLAAAAVVGRHGVAVAATAHQILKVPGSTRLIVPGPQSPPFRFSVSAPSVVVQQAGPIAVLAVGLLAIAVVGLLLAVFFWSPWFRRGSGRELH